jgi:hypothetical protein
MEVYRETHLPAASTQEAEQTWLSEENIDKSRTKGTQEQKTPWAQTTGCRHLPQVTARSVKRFRALEWIRRKKSDIRSGRDCESETSISSCNALVEKSIPEALSGLSILKTVVFLVLVSRRPSGLETP